MGEARKPLRSHSVRPLPGPRPVKLRYPNGGNGPSEEAHISRSKGNKLYPQRMPNPALEKRQALPFRRSRPRKITEPALVPFTSCDSARFCGARGGAHPQAPSPRARRADCAEGQK